MPFVYLHLTLYGGWIAFNAGLIPGLQAFDPSFVILAMVASVEAIFLSTFVLISPAIQMLLARPGPVFPRRIRGRRFQARRLAALLRYVIPALRWLERFGDGTKVHLRFSRWAKSGVWERVFQHLAADADNEYAMIDSTIVRAHQHSAGAKKKPARTRRLDARAAD